MEFDLPESMLEELQKVWRQEWKKLTLADDFIFSRIICRAAHPMSLNTGNRKVFLCRVYVCSLLKVQLN